MCGIAGLLESPAKRSSERLSQVMQHMADSLRHRGPDDEGIWIEPDCSAALAHRRLSVIDLSPTGHQPMVSDCGRYVLVFNGEVYNHEVLRAQLIKEGHGFRGRSDTEVLLKAISAWGLGTALTGCNGMFAFAVWDRRERLLHLARDRFGEKPIYYGWHQDCFVFASELRAIVVSSDVKPEIDRNSVAAYLRYGYIPAPHSIYRGLSKLMPGTVLTVTWDRLQEHAFPQPYWSVREVARTGVANGFKGSADDAISELNVLLRDAVRLRMEADVPLGAFLSGGLDSTAVVAMMQAESGKPVKTFTVGFDVPGYNEAAHAKQIAGLLGTDHTELYVTAGDAIKVLENLPHLYDEPFGDSSQVPTYLVARLARQHVTVALSGDGGDELFGGYTRYLLCEKIWSFTRRVPGTFRQAAAAVIRSVPPLVWDRILGGWRMGIFEGGRSALSGDRINKLADVLGVASSQELYLRLMSHWQTPDSIVRGGQEQATSLMDAEFSAFMPDLVGRMMLLDAETYLPNDILIKLDRATMAVSLEARVPLLDHRVAEFAWRMHRSLKVRNGEGKWVLRRVVERYLPTSVVNRPKMGFSIPLDRWLRGPLRDWAETLLDEAKLRQAGMLNPGPIHRKWAEHLSGARSWHAQLWAVLMFQAWYQYSHCGGA